MLRKIRLMAATLCFVLITLLFLDFTGTLHGWFGWLAKIQFLPAVLALNVGVVLLLILLTLVFGRIYCSVICPLGVFQDVIARFACAFLAALWSAGCFCGGFSGRGWFLCRFAGALQCLRTYCQQLAPAALDVGKQFVGLSGGTDGQLRLLRGGCLDEEPADAFSCGRYGGRAFRLGLAERAYVLQYDLSGGDSVGLHLPLFPLSHHDRYGEMQQLRPLYPPMQGGLYRWQAA